MWNEDTLSAHELLLLSIEITIWNKWKTKATYWTLAAEVAALKASELWQARAGSWREYVNGYLPINGRYADRLAKVSEVVTALMIGYQPMDTVHLPRCVKHCEALAEFNPDYWCEIWQMARQEAEVQHARVTVDWIRNVAPESLEGGIYAYANWRRRNDLV